MILNDTFDVKVYDMGYDTITIGIEQFLSEPVREDFASDDQLNYALEVYSSQSRRFKMKVARENLNELTVGSFAKVNFVNDAPVLLIFRGAKFGVKED